MPLTPEGMVNGVDLHQLPESKRLDLEYRRSCKGRPWSTTPNAREAAAPFAGQWGPTTPAPIVISPGEQIVRKRLYVLNSDVSRFGPTPGCKGCLEVTESAVGGTRRKESNTAPHSADCRARITACLERG